jgi:uncharacterized protein
MSLKLIPETIDPFRYAEQDVRLDGIVNVADMQRLSALLVSNDKLVSVPGKNVVNVDLRFGKDEQGIAFLNGHLETELMLECQRCMEPYLYQLASRFQLGIVSTLDEANALPDSYEPTLTHEGRLPLREVIEDEVILNLPIIPRHKPEDCRVNLPSVDESWEQKKGNPFDVLRTLKTKKNKT